METVHYCKLPYINWNQSTISRLVIFYYEFSIALTDFQICEYEDVLSLNRINALWANGGSRFTFGDNEIRF